MRRRSLVSALLAALPFGIGGNGFLDRIKAISFAMLGLTAAAALAMVAFVANQGWPQVGSLLPIPAAHRQAVADNSVVAGPAPGHGSFRFATPKALAGATPASGGAPAQPSSPTVQPHGARDRGGSAPGDNVVVSAPAPSNPGAEPAATPTPVPAPAPPSTPAEEAPSGSSPETQSPTAPSASPPTAPPVSTPTTDPTPTTPDEGNPAEEGDGSGSESGSESEGGTVPEPGGPGPASGSEQDYDHDHGHWGGHGHVGHQLQPTPPVSTPPTSTPPPPVVPVPSPPSADESGSIAPPSEDGWRERVRWHSLGRSH